MTRLELLQEHINIREFGGTYITVQSLLDMMLESRRDRFLKILYNMYTGDVAANRIPTGFDCVGFTTATSDFKRFFNEYEENYEGNMEYELIIGEYCWNCKTTIVWTSELPTACGSFKYHTTITPSQNARCVHIETQEFHPFKIHMIKKELSEVTCKEVLHRDRKNLGLI